MSIFDDDGNFDIGMWGCLATALMMGYVLWCIVHYGLR